LAARPATRNAVTTPPSMHKYTTPIPPRPFHHAHSTTLRTCIHKFSCESPCAHTHTFHTHIAMTRSTSRSRIPTPSSRLPLPRRPGTAMGTPMSTPTSTPNSARRRVVPARAQSVDPEKMAKQMLNDRLLLRPSSSR